MKLRDCLTAAEVCGEARADSHILLKYVRDRFNRRTGVIVALCVNGEIRLGWSKCNRRDEFNKKMGIKIALGRALCAGRNTREQPKIPPSYTDELKVMYTRGLRYFKQAVKKVAKKIELNPK